MEPLANKIIMNPEAAAGMMPGAERSIADERKPVSYTHLTLPTSDLV